MESIIIPWMALCLFELYVIYRQYKKLIKLCGAYNSLLGKQKEFYQRYIKEVEKKLLNIENKLKQINP